MNETLSWDDLRLFLAVARAGGLAGAAKSAGVSAPTLGRRMLALEQSLRRALFVRQRDGYVLTDGGQDLLRLAEAFELDALRIDRWRTSSGIGAVVRIAAGAWTSAFIARHIASLVDPDENTQIELVTGTSAADLLRREANLGLRNRRPELPGLAGYKLTRVAFAAYGGQAYVKETAETRDHRRFTACRWIAHSPPGPKTPSAVWLDERLERAPALRCRSPQEVLEAAGNGFGLCVLPCFIGDSSSALARASDNIDALEHEQWLVSHDQDRHQKHIRHISDRLRTLIKANRNLFAGQRATPVQSAQNKSGQPGQP
jgi:DNA-binding transcriptional LysR family regulator